MGHNSGFLSGPEPEEKEEKTAAELEDKKRPAAMAVSSSMYDLAETDDRPAIEQKVAKGTLFGNEKQAKSEAKIANSQPGGSKKFEIDESFVKEMHEREAKEKAEREKKRKAAKAAEAEAAKKHEIETQSELTKPRTLDGIEEREQLYENQQQANEQKLYPDPVKNYTDADDAIFKRDTAKQGKLPNRARLDEKYDEQLHKSILQAYACNVAAIIMYVMYHATLRNHRIPKPVNIISIIVAIGFLLFAGYILYQAGKKCHLHTIPYDQRNAYILALVGPGIALRIGSAAILSSIMNVLPFNIGGTLGTIAGFLCGASIYYTILSNYNIVYGEELVLINAALLSIIYIVLPLFVETLFNPVSSFGMQFAGLAMQLMGDLGIIAIVFLCEHFAMKVTRTAKP